MKYNGIQRHIESAVRRAMIDLTPELIDDLKTDPNAKPIPMESPTCLLLRFISFDLSATLKTRRELRKLLDAGKCSRVRIQQLSATEYMIEAERLPCFPLADLAELLWDTFGSDRKLHVVIDRGGLQHVADYLTWFSSDFHFV